VEKPIATGCTACHWTTDVAGEGTGFTLDPVRHNKPFNATALDQCGGCHNYKSGETVATTTWTTGGGTKPISKRVHSVHNGAALNYPTLTVDHEDTTSASRNWNITYPMDVRNCESCHPKDATSGTWKTNPNRLACMGCHDSDAATAHMKIQVYDPTPSAPWSGDEAEACAACHQ
jgi:decaheme cytochrome c component MtrC/MtrF-like protein